MVTWVCLTCGITGRGWGNNPLPIGAEPAFEGRRVCDNCNAMYVLPARLGRPVEGPFYDERGEIMGGFRSVPRHENK